MTSRSRLLIDNLRQRAVLWTGPTNDGFGGRTFSDVVAIAVRWQDRNELVVDQQGRQVTSKAVVYLKRDVPIGSYLMLGKLADLSSGAEEPMQLEAAFEVIAVETIPSVDAGRFLRKVWV